MKVTRVYLDTSTIGGCFDHEFAPWSKGLIEDFAAGRYLPVISYALAAELARAPERVREVYQRILAQPHEYVDESEESAALQRAYAERKILPGRFKNDLAHVALATVSGADVLASWNFKHIVRFDKIRRFNAVNLELGYRPIAIHSPRELTGNERE